MRYLRAKRWPPYAVGAGIGVLSWFSFATADRPIGVSTAISKTVGMVESQAAARHVAQNPYFATFRPAVDWEWMLAAGLALGAFVSSRLSGDKPGEPVDRLWAARFGGSRSKRYLAAFLGGTILMFGARLAGGCTSGHGISGSLQLALSGWIFFASVFASGLATAALLFGKEKVRG
ncbi:MAG: YeeE/YedE family protein [Acidobacteriota bacterium]|nr:YeeE/YedE family protein [Acidobacteriota bacterium]